MEPIIKLAVVITGGEFLGNNAPGAPETSGGVSIPKLSGNGERSSMTFPVCRELQRNAHHMSRLDRQRFYYFLWQSEETRRLKSGDNLDHIGFRKLPFLNNRLVSGQQRRVLNGCAISGNR